MTDEKSAYLPVSIHGRLDELVALEFLPLKTDVDGIWVRTTITRAPFRAEFEWFLPGSMQSELASCYSDLMQGKALAEFAMRDTDCSFVARFIPNVLNTAFEITLELQQCWGDRTTDVELRIMHVSSTISDVQAFLNRISRFG